VDEVSVSEASVGVEEKARRCRRWSEEEKRTAVELSLEPGANVKEVAACFGVSPSQIYAWRSELRGSDSTEFDFQFSLIYEHASVDTC
jgi:transposase-like protein